MQFFGQPSLDQFLSPEKPVNSICLHLRGKSGKGIFLQFQRSHSKYCISLLRKWKAFEIIATGSKLFPDEMSRLVCCCQAKNLELRLDRVVSRPVPNTVRGGLRHACDLYLDSSKL